MKAQQVALEGRIAEFDVVITTAAVPGRAAPKIIPASAVQAMRPGSVIVDLAAETGGNCELTVPGEIAVRENVTLVGLTNLPSTMPYHALTLYSRNVQALLLHLAPEGQLNLDWSRPDHRRRMRRGQEGGSHRVSHNTLLVFEVTILVLAIFLGVEVISKFPTLRHTPLMSGTNAIHGIVIVARCSCWGSGTRACTSGSSAFDGGRARVGERRRRLRRHRPHARDVQEARAAAKPVDASQNGKGT